MFGVFLAGLMIGLACGAFLQILLLCHRKPDPAKILTSDNQGENRQTIPVQVRIGSDANGLAAAVVDPMTGKRIAFANNTATVWQQQVAPGADTCRVICLLEGVPVVWEGNDEESAE